nr:retrovirus-related Pol polyprotein from transposon TNT 1-94 [Tanacetum cinerariifolium]GEX93875.1 retrovirus-related Pol polyprotein from transposon TNT 1-94 [Tanacetum cinerariifolium]
MMIQRNLQAPVITVRTDRGTEFLNKTLNAFFKEEGIEHQTSTARIPEQNSVVERRNRTLASDYDNPDPVPQRQDVYSSADADVPSQQELDLLFGPLYDEFFNADSNPSMNIQSTSAPSTHTNVYAEENNNDQAKEGEQLQDDEFTNPFYALTQDVVESSSYNIGNSNVLTFNQLQAKYTLEIPHKHGMDKGQNIGTPMATKPKLDADLSGNPVDQTDYRSKIGSLMYLIFSRPDIVTEYQLADMFTKALPEDRFKYLVRRIGMRCLTPAELEVLAKEYA